MEFTACQNKVTFTQVTVQLGHSAKLSKADSRRANEEDATEKKRPQSHKQEKRKANQQYSGVLSKDAFHQEGCFSSGRGSQTEYERGTFRCWDIGTAK